MSRTLIAAFIGGITGVIFTTYAAYAWAGPTQAAPGGNVSAPINIGTGSQVKNGNLSVNAFTGTQDSIFYGKLGVGSSNAPTYVLDVTGAARTTGEIISTNANQFRMVQGNYGAFFRNDGANTYLLLTNSGDQYGSWNSLRPFYVNDASGAVTVGTSLGVSGAATVGSTLTASGQIYTTSGGYKFPDGTVQTTAASAATIPAGTTCGIATYKSDGGSCSSPYNSVSAITCQGVNVMNSCPSGYTQVSYKTGDVFTTTDGATIWNCVRTCAKN